MKKNCVHCEGRGKKIITTGDYFDMDPTCEFCKGTGEQPPEVEK